MIDGGWMMADHYVLDAWLDGGFGLVDSVELVRSGWWLAAGSKLWEPHCSQTQGGLASPLVAGDCLIPAGDWLVADGWWAMNGCRCVCCWRGCSVGCWVPLERHDSFDDMINHTGPTRVSSP